ncbi:hypothetical protein [Aureimonas leprariae]|uniref:Uncharacterized protein n=1 Tax=Plantimonas leprariae TaxID=2615207 RepID=A0A7V7TWL9_9HYPH|nr:hypothetical protein [Aureimonas leprariae]KAB0679750.1 hypothetical protein F6X38_11000 [Aureimonas leprariae]
MTDKRDAEKRDADHPTAGTNSRPLNDTIAQTGGGVPDDTSEAVEVEPEEQKRMEDNLLRPR